MSAISGNIECMELLLEQRASLDQRNLFDDAPLNLAVLLGRDAVVDRLLKADACLGSNKFGLNPLHYAALSLGESSITDDVCRRLVAGNCDPDLRVRIPPRTLHGLVSHTALVTYKQGRQQHFTWMSSKLNGKSPSDARCEAFIWHCSAEIFILLVPCAGDVACIFGNSPVVRALVDATVQKPWQTPAAMPARREMTEPVQASQPMLASVPTTVDFLEL